MQAAEDEGEGGAALQAAGCGLQASRVWTARVKASKRHGKTAGCEVASLAARLAAKLQGCMLRCRLQPEAARVLARLQGRVQGCRAAG